MLRKFLHWLSHLLGNYTGSVITWSDDEFIYVGFECDVCKKVDPTTINKINSDLIFK